MTTAKTELLAKGIGASPGVATGQIVFRSEDAVALAEKGEPVILVKIEATSEDVPGMRAAVGILTTRGGLTGDAAVVARSLGKPCIAQCAPLRVDYVNETLTVWRDSANEEPDIVLTRGAVITIDGGRGEVFH